MEEGEEAHPEWPQVRHAYFINFTCLLYFYTHNFSISIVDLVTREDDVSDADNDDPKMPAVKTSYPKWKQSVPQPAA